jgi:hypothetical protein
LVAKEIFFWELVPAFHYNLFKKEISLRRRSVQSFFKKDLLRQFGLRPRVHFNRGYRCREGLLLPRRKRSKKAWRPNYNLQNYLRRATTPPGSFAKTVHRTVSLRSALG